MSQSPSSGPLVSDEAEQSLDSEKESLPSL
jgi:hypothetical protein